MSHSRSCPPLVLPAAIALAFRGAISSIDVRVVISVKQMIDGYKTVDRIVIATREGFFLCIAATGEFSRYVKWDAVQEVHWYPCLQLAAFICGDGCDIVIAATSASSGVNTSNNTQPNVGGPRSPPTSPRQSSLSFGNPQQLPQPQQDSAAVASSSGTSSLPYPIRSIVQRVRSSTVNFGRARPTVASSSGIIAVNGTPLSSTSTNASMFAFGAPPSTQQQLPDIQISPYTGDSNVSTFGGVSPPSTSDDASVLLLTGTGSPATSFASASYRPSNVQWGGRLPLGPAAPSTLVEFIEWASALSHSRAYHAVIPNAFIVIQNTSEHLNAWQAYRVKRPSGLTMDVPIEVIPSEHLHATEADLQCAKLRRHEDDTRSAGELRRAALMLGGLHVVNELLEKDWNRTNTAAEVESPQQRPALHDLDNDVHLDPMADLPLEVDGPSSSSLMGDVEATAPFMEAIVQSDSSPARDERGGGGGGRCPLTQSPSTASLGGRQPSRRDSDYSFEDPNSFASDGGGGRKRGLTLFCSGDDGGRCVAVGGGAYRATRESNTGVSARSAVSSSGQGSPPPSTTTRHSRVVRSVAAQDDGDDGFIVIDNPETHVWRSSPPHDLPREEQCSWWRQHSSALVRENKGLRQEADELRLRLSMLQYEVNSQRGGITTNQGDATSNLSSSQRRHRLPF
jgi:hypothetical protein